MFHTYTIDTITWTAVPRADLDPTVSTTSRVFHDGANNYVKVKVLPVAGIAPEDAIYQISSSKCDVSGKAISGGQGQIVLTSPRRITCNAVSVDVALDAQLDAAIQQELRLYMTLTDSLAVQENLMVSWAA